MIEWTDSLVDDEILLPHWVDTIDMDSDGDVDIYASGFSSHEISWYENDTENKKWIKHNVTTNIPFTLAVTAGDMDNDSDIDFIGTSPNSGQVIILENEGDNIIFKHTITNNMLGAWPVCVGYITDDEYLDIAAGANNLGKISWFKNDTVNTTSIYFKEIEITQNIEVFPNPAKDVINIKMELTEKSVLKIELFDITGKKIDETETLYTNQKIFHKAFYLNDNIESGIYFLKIRVNNIVQTKHIIIG
jgi:hypothetical protein